MQTLAAELEEEIAKHPPHVAEVMRARPPNTCYRVPEQRNGHYWIRGYIERSKEDGSPEPVRITLVHGSDSFLPGMSVQSVEPESITPCDCGRWKNATDDQMYFMQEHLASLHLARQGAARPGPTEDLEVHALQVRLVELHRVARAFVDLMDRAIQSEAQSLEVSLRAADVGRAYEDLKFVLTVFQVRPS